MKRVRKFFIIFLAAALIFGALPVGTAASDISEKYGYAFLTDSQKELYDLLDGAIASAQDSVEVSPDLCLTLSDVEVVKEVLDSDRPEYFWFGAVSVTTRGDWVIRVKPKYTLGGVSVTASQISSARSSFNSSVNALISQMYRQAENDDYGKALWLHDRVAELTEYLPSDNDQNAYGALMEGKAVCAGYAKLYQHLLRQAGIPAWTVKGQSVNPTSGTAESHAWTLMWIDGRCVYTDVTWDDQAKSAYHVYFARSLTVFNADHRAEAIFSPMLPVCSNTQCSQLGYFQRVGVENSFSSVPTANEVAALLLPENNGFSVTAVLYDTDDSRMLQWISESSNHSAVIRQAGLPAASYSITASSLGNSVSGREIHLTYTSSVQIKGSLTGETSSYLDGGESVILQLIEQGESEASYETIVTGSGADYAFSNVVSGIYTLRVMKKNHETRDYTVTVVADEVVQNVKVVPKGDVNGDGRLNARDSNALKSYLKNSLRLSDYSYSCADVNGDGRVNARDLSAIKMHLVNKGSVWS